MQKQNTKNLVSKLRELICIPIFLDQKYIFHKSNIKIVYGF